MFLRRDHVALLACPITGSALDLRNAVFEEGTIRSGELVSKEGRSYAVRNGVPRFVGLMAETQPLGSVESFGYEWNTLNFDSFFLNWEEHIARQNFGSRDYFKGKVIVDAGAGSGMHSRWMIESGAKLVISLELSQSVDGVMRQNLRQFADRSLVIQADIAYPPIRCGVVDLVYCLNVIQHTADPQRTTQSLYRLMGPRSEMFVNYYLREEEMPLPWKARQLLREEIFSRLPKAVTLNLFRLLSLAAMVPGLDALLCRALLVRGDVPPGPRYLARKYKQTVLNSYDYYGAHDYQYYFSEKMLRALFAEAGIRIDRVPNFSDVIHRKAPGHAFRFLPDA
jgi:SAM-dependent methyltransferase